MPGYREKSGLRYTRYDFLRFDVSSIQSAGNRKTFKLLREKEKTSSSQERSSTEQENQEDNTEDDDSSSKQSEEEENSRDDETFLEEESEDWEGSWSQYPDIPPLAPDHDLSKDGPALKFIAWMVHTFAPDVCFNKTSLTTYRESVLGAGMRFLGLDDIVFLFVQVQHNIYRWNLVFGGTREDKDGNGSSILTHDNREEKTENMTAKQKQLIKKINGLGYEYPHGSGVSGKDGRYRYGGMTKYFYRAYYSNQACPVVRANREALSSALKAMVTADMESEKEAEDEGETTGVEQQQQQKRTREDPWRDSELEKIHDDIWSSMTCGISMISSVADEQSGEHESWGGSSTSRGSSLVQL